MLSSRNNTNHNSLGATVNMGDKITKYCVISFAYALRSHLTTIRRGIEQKIVLDNRYSHNRHLRSNFREKQGYIQIRPSSVSIRF